MIKIQEIPESERPREKMRHKGVNHLSDAELLAILISSGNKKKSALDLAYELLNRYGSLKGLQRIPMEELLQIDGIYEAIASRIIASFELLRRFESEFHQKKMKILSLEDALSVLLPLCLGIEQERVFLILLNDESELQRIETLFIGSEDRVICTPKEILKAVIKSGASKVYLCHNHPSGCGKASKRDIEVSDTLYFYLQSCEITLLDSLVIGEKESYSIFEKKIIHNQTILKP